MGFLKLVLRCVGGLHHIHGSVSSPVNIFLLSISLTEVTMNSSVAGSTAAVARRITYCFHGRLSIRMQSLLSTFHSKQRIWVINQLIYEGGVFREHAITRGYVPRLYYLLLFLKYSETACGPLVMEFRGWYNAAGRNQHSASLQFR
jgi:hypothetical protein